MTTPQFQYPLTPSLPMMPGDGVPAPLSALRNIDGSLGPRCVDCSGYGIRIQGIRDGVRGGCMGHVGTCATCRGTGVELPDPFAMFDRLGQLERRIAAMQIAGVPDVQMMSRQFWRETIAWSTANGTTISNSTTETILMPDVTIPANYLQDGRALQIVLMGKLSNIVTTPGTLTFALRWGGVSGTVLAQSSAMSLNTTAQTDIMFRIELELVTRANGSSGSVLAMGFANVAALATQAPQFMGSAGGSSGNTPAAVTANLTADTALSITAKFSIANAGNAITGMQYLIDSLN